MKPWVGGLLIASMVGFCVCFAGSANGRDDIAMVGFLMIFGGLFGVVLSIIVAEIFDA